MKLDLTKSVAKDLAATFDTVIQDTRQRTLRKHLTDIMWLNNFLHRLEAIADDDQVEPPKPAATAATEPAKSAESVKPAIEAKETKPAKPK